MLAEHLDSFETAAEVKEDDPPSSKEGSDEQPREILSSNGPRRLSNPVTSQIRNLASKSLPSSPELHQITNATVAKIGSFKKWTMNTYKNTKHLCMEHIGKINKTVDTDLEARIETLREMRKCYREVLSTSRHFSNYLALASNVQQSMANALSELAMKETTIAKELNIQSELFMVMGQNVEPLQRSLALFLSSLQTLCDSTIEDTFLTIESHDQARFEFDVGRQELQSARANPNSTPQTIALVEEQCNQLSQKYEQLKDDVRAKLVLLEENRCKVMCKQVLALHKAFGAFHLSCGQSVERVSECDLTKIGELSGAQDSLPTTLSTSIANGFQSFLENQIIYSSQKGPCRTTYREEKK